MTVLNTIGALSAQHEDLTFPLQLKAKILSGFSGIFCCSKTGLMRAVPYPEIITPVSAASLYSALDLFQSQVAVSVVVAGSPYCNTHKK